jgi:hypothetical protein
MDLKGCSLEALQGRKTSTAGEPLLEIEKITELKARGENGSGDSRNAPMTLISTVFGLL